MNTPEDEIKKLQSIFPGATLWPDGNRTIAFFPSIKIESDGKTRQVDALLYPYDRDGYTSRLFLSEPFTNKGQNWNVFAICGRTWHACSWNGVPSNIPWLEILLAHLRVLA